MELPAGSVGEIWVAGPSVAAGYWDRAAETAETFQATLAGGGGQESGPFLRTGDLGFLAGGELFVTGRLKDLIILRGRNHYPQDLERTAERGHPALRPGGAAAFSVDAGGEERLVLVCEVDRHFAGPAEEIAAAVRQAIAEEHEAQVHEVVLIRMATLPKTSSGKVQRRACRAAWLAGGLAVTAVSALGALAAVTAVAAAGGEGALLLTREALLALPAGARRPALLAFLGARAAAAGLGTPGPEEPLTGLGLDSLSAVDLKTAVEGALGVAVPLAELLAGAGTGAIADQVLAGLAAPAAAVEPLPEETAEGEAPPSAGQKALWFLHRLAPASTAYHLAGAFRLSPAVDPERLRRAFQALLDRHPALRATFAAGADGPVQRIGAGERVAFRHEEGAGAAELLSRARGEAFRPFDLERGPLFRAALFTGGPEGDLLVVAVHHIAADFWSLAVLVRELGLLLAGEVPPAPAATYAGWAREQERELAGPRGEALWSYWRERLAGAPELALPTDRPRPPVQTYAGAALPFRLGPGVARDLRDLARAAGCTPFMVLLAGFQALLARYSGQEDFLVGAPTAGRTSGGGRLAGVVGYFVNPVALRADLAGDPTVREWLARVRATALGAFAHQDLPFALLAERLQPDRDPGRPPCSRRCWRWRSRRCPGWRRSPRWPSGRRGSGWRSPAA